MPRSIKPNFSYISTFASRQVRITSLRPFACSLCKYTATSSLASPCLRYSGKTSSPSSIIFFPFGLCKPASVKNSSRSFGSSVASPFKNPAIFPFPLSTATRNSSEISLTLSHMFFSEQASFGGKQIRSISAACSASPCSIFRNSNLS